MGRNSGDATAEKWIRCRRYLASLCYQEASQLTGLALMAQGAIIPMPATYEAGCRVGRRLTSFGNANGSCFLVNA